ncbi:MAG TPA: class I SAM-dependent methyltransferase [Vicinamibacterales bacterium]|nr:class I SAM-dependent methyltransferase [Vicinamibacterales bacterium]
MAEKNFDRVAGIYAWLERAAFGRDLERARVQFLDRARDCRNILVLGDGDGRALMQLLAAAPRASIRSVDASAAMLERAKNRVATLAGADRVVFEHADARRIELGAARYDAVVTLFFLDCFTTAEVEALVARVLNHLVPGGLWIYADFELPQNGVARLRGRAWLALLYGFFRWQTGITARELPPSRGILVRLGLIESAVARWRRGLIVARAFRRPFARAAAGPGA